MKRKRLIALFMCLVMVMSLFTACSKKEDDDKDEKDKTEQTSPEPTDEAEPTDEPEPTKEPENDDDVFDYEKGIDVTTLDEGDDFDQFLNEVYLSLITTRG